MSKSAIVLITLLASSWVYGLGPLQTRSQSPLYLLFLTDKLQRGVLPLKEKEISASLETVFSNIFDYSLNDPKTKLILDGELWRHAIQINYGVNDNFNMGFELPFLTYSGGFLDPFVSNFHNFFGFPNGGREQVPPYQLKIYVKHGSMVYNPKPTSFGLGDLTLWSQFAILDETNFIPAMSLKTLLKLPTGRTDNATGSGNADLGLSLFVEKSIWRFHSYSLAGLAVHGSMKELAPILRSWMVYFGQALEFEFLESLSLVAQLSGNTPIFQNVAIPELTYPVLDLNVGFTGTVSWFRYEFAFSEDILCAGPSVDFSVQFKIGFVI